MSGNRVGSVFLGDVQRHRHLSSSTHSGTPPSSPPPPHHPSSPLSMQDIGIDMDPSELAPVPVVSQHFDVKSQQALSAESLKGPGKIDPMLALELRLRWLEALIVGVKQDLVKGKAKGDNTTSVSAAAASMNPGETLSRMAGTVQQRFGKAVEANPELKKFMERYDQNAHLLTPSFALSGILPDPPTYDKMSPEEFNAYLSEMEPDIRNADRDMREIDTLEKKGVTGAGKLGASEQLRPRLDALIKAHAEDLELATSLELRIASLVERHATYVDTLSELFVAWDDTVTEAETRIARMERERAERLRLGYE
ncbi:hypothetical protein CVT24_000688 [Panaeolus cyanescens]|uniref:Uncharacterized protein n=1 Tax=Panaeolus cyanescens TaxID=181874 RepID=A0A409W729_9AGAR|nr:hypothetical protein CVT24_000688 [Panaeolus cyanescens]